MPRLPVDIPRKSPVYGDLAPRGLVTCSWSEQGRETLVTGSLKPLNRAEPAYDRETRTRNFQNQGRVATAEAEL